MPRNSRPNPFYARVKTLILLLTAGLSLLAVTVVFLPIVLIYTAWVYKVLFGRIEVKALKTNPDLY